MDTPFFDSETPALRLVFLRLGWNIRNSCIFIHLCGGGYGKLYNTPPYCHGFFLLYLYKFTFRTDFYAKDC